MKKWGEKFEWTERVNGFVRNTDVYKERRRGRTIRLLSTALLPIQVRLFIDENNVALWVQVYNFKFNDYAQKNGTHFVMSMKEKYLINGPNILLAVHRI